MGEVYEAIHEPLSRRVAIKTILPELAAQPALFTRFRREAETSAALGPPNIDQVTDFQSLPGEPPLIVMELLEGETLRQLVAREGRLEPGRAAFIGLQILSGLAAAHRAGIVHRDVKPGNVFVTSTLAVRDLVKVVDFGIAKLVADAHAAAEKVTALGQVLGTLAYMAPEQAEGTEVDHRADIYAVGGTLFHALSGISPMDAIIPGAPRATLAQMAPWLPPALSAVVDRAMARSPADRFASAEEMAAALAPFAEPARSGHGAAAAAATTSAASRFSAPTASGTGGPGSGPTAAPPTRVGPSTGTWGATQPDAPHGWATLGVTPAPYGPPVVAAPSHLRWVVPLVVALSALFVVGYGAPQVLAVLATRPSAIEEGAERRFLERTNLPPCRAPDACTETHEDHGVSFPVCTNRAPALASLETGDAVLVTRDGASRSALIQDRSPDGSYTVSWLTGSEDEVVPGSAVVARLCGRGARKKHVD